jgi:hypothetical protein
MTEKKYPRKFRLTVYLAEGVDPIRGNPITVNDEFEEAKWGSALRDFKSMSYLGLTQADGFGGVDNIYINPKYIVAIRLADVE